MAEWSGRVLSVFQICCLIVFLAIVVGQAVSLRIRSKVNPITLRIKKRGLLGAVEMALFVQVNVWAAAVVVHAVPGLVRPGSQIWSGSLVDAAWVKLMGVVTIVIGFVIFISALRSLGSSWRLGIDESHPGRLVTSGIYRAYLAYRDRTARYWAWKRVLHPYRERITG